MRSGGKQGSRCTRLPRLGTSFSSIIRGSSHPGSLQKKRRFLAAAPSCSF